MAPRPFLTLFGLVAGLGVVTGFVVSGVGARGSDPVVVPGPGTTRLADGSTITLGPGETVTIRGKDRRIVAQSSFVASGYRYRPAVLLFGRLQDAVRRHDAEGVAKVVGFPLRVNGAAGGHRVIAGRGAFLRGYARIVTPRVARLVAAADPRKLFARDVGVMLGHGVAWATSTGGAGATLRVTTLNG